MSRGSLQGPLSFGRGRRKDDEEGPRSPEIVVQDEEGGHAEVSEVVHSDAGQVELGLRRWNRPDHVFGPSGIRPEPLRRGDLPQSDTHDGVQTQEQGQVGWCGGDEAINVVSGRPADLLAT